MMKARKILNVCAILTLFVLLLCFLFFSYTALWSTHYWNGEFFNKQEYDTIKTAGFNGIDIISVTPLRGVVFIILTFLNLILCFTSLLSKKNNPDPILHVVLPTITGIHFASYILIFFWSIKGTFNSIMALKERLHIPEEAKLSLSDDYKAKAFFLLFLMLAFIILCYVKRSKNFADVTTATVQDESHPVGSVPQSPIDPAPIRQSASRAPTTNTSPVRQPSVASAPVPSAAAVGVHTQPTEGMRPVTTSPRPPVNGPVPPRPMNYGGIPNRPGPYGAPPRGYRPAPPNDINYYYDLLQKGIITQEEFDAKKKQLLGL